MVVLDTDLMTLLESRGSASLSLQIRLERLPIEETVTTIITYEEQMRGWFARAAQANTTERMVAGV